MFELDESLEGVLPARKESMLNGEPPVGALGLAGTGGLDKAKPLVRKELSCCC